MISPFFWVTAFFETSKYSVNFFSLLRKTVCLLSAEKKANAEKKQEGKKKAFQHQDTADMYLFALGDFAVMPWKLNKRNWESCRSEAHMLSLEFRHLVIVLSVMLSVSTLREISVRSFDLKTFPPTCRHQHQHTRLSSQQNVCRLLTFTGQGWIYPKPFLRRQKM